MKKLLGVPVMGALLLVIGLSAAEASDCGAARYTCGKQKCCRQQCYTVMKTCKEVVYEEEEHTLYKTVYKEVIDKKTIDTVEYEEQTRYRCRPCTVWQPRPAESCETINSCAPADCCQPEKPSEMAPVTYIRKVPYTVLVKKPVKKVEEVPRCVSTLEPYTVTRCIPKVVYRQVPVEVCCPMPYCCKPRCSRPECCGN